MRAIELANILDHYTEHQHTARIRAIRIAMRRHNLLPAYSDPVTAQEAGLFLWTFAACPVSWVDGVDKWISAQRDRMAEAYRAGVQLHELPHFAIADLLTDRKRLYAIAWLAIERNLGAVAVQLAEGGPEAISTYAARDTDRPDGKRVGELVIYHTPFLDRIARAIVLGEQLRQIEATERAISQFITA